MAKTCRGFLDIHKMVVQIGSDRSKRSRYGTKVCKPWIRIFAVGYAISAQTERFRISKKISLEKITYQTQPHPSKLLNVNLKLGYNLHNLIFI